VKVLRDVTPALAEQYVGELERKVKRGTVNAYLGTMRRIWRVIEPRGQSPWDALRATIPPSESPYRRFTPKECRKLYRNADKRYKPLILVLYYTALRLYDAVHLAWDRTDPSRLCVITMDRLMIRVVPRKTSRLRKTVTIPIVGELALFLSKVSKTKRHGFVFPDYAYRYSYNQWWFGKHFKKIMEDSGIASDESGHASLHSFRKTFVSLMDEAGIHVKITDSITGHASAGTLHDRYSDIDLEAARKALRQALPRLGPRRNTKVPRQSP